MARAVIGIDQGSSSTKALLLDESGVPLFSERVDVSTTHPGPGLYEQDAKAIRSSVRHLLERASDVAKGQGIAVSAIGIATQRSGVVAWNETGEPLTPLLTWRDGRCEDELKNLGAVRERLAEIAGIPLMPQLAGPKIARLQREFPDSNTRVGTLDSFLAQCLTAERLLATDDSMASRSFLYDTPAGTWGTSLCQALAIDPSRLPHILPSLGLRGHIAGIPLVAFLGDRQAALFREYVLGRDALLNIGTLVSIVLHANKRVETPGWLPGVFFSQEQEGRKHREFLAEGAIPAIGRTLTYLSEKLQFMASSLDQRWMTGAETRQHWPISVVNFVSSGSPLWRSDAPSVVVGWDGCNTELLGLSLIESIVFSLSHVLALLKNGGLIGGSVAVSGGRDTFQIPLPEVSALSGVPLILTGERDSGACGVAYAALRALRGVEWQPAMRMTPEAVVSAASEVAKRRFVSWRTLSARVLSGDIPSDSRELLE